MAADQSFKDPAGKRFSGLALLFFIFLPLLPAVLALVNYFSN